ncbi:MAG: T9SS type A sorting domain-containing protein [Saprospiraceae bacterium]|nr:T9SS type A sorting domain-containing protein [Saprospiraceae bacterium]
MKRWYPIFFSFFVGFALQAQVEVVFKLDMNDEIIQEEGLFLIGSFQNWDLDEALILEEENDSGIYSVSVDLSPGSHNYRFVNGLTNNVELECEEVGICFGDCFIETDQDQMIRYVVVEKNAFKQTLATHKFNSCEETFPASVEELNQSSGLSINPNPFSQSTTLTIGNPNNKRFEVLLFDVSGQLLRRYGDQSGTGFQIERGDLSTGFYLLSLRTDKGEVANRKLVIH